MSIKRQQKDLKLYETLFLDTFVPLFLMVTTPIIALLFPYIIVFKNSNLTKTLINQSVLITVQESWASIKWSDLEIWLFILCTLIWGIISLHFPGTKYHAPPTSNGFRPTYWHNGFRFYIVSMIISIILVAKYSMIYWYYKVPSLIGILIVTGFVMCFLLYIKGLLAPSPGVYKVTKNPIFDYYWGVELYPNLGPYISLKMLIICRFSLFLWQLIILGCWKANYELYNGQINWPLTAITLLQTYYLAKFYYWEDGYMNTIDTCVERLGYYIAWGCWVWVPAFFTINNLYMVQHSPTDQFKFGSFILIIVLGLIVISLTYWTDRQKQITRATNGNCKIWRKQAKIINAIYTDEHGNKKRAILLASGFWSIARHLNYTFELLSALTWSLPALFTSPIPYFYFIFLTILLIHRSFRDDNRLSQKYGVYWNQYCKLVPYKMIPGIF